MYTPTYHYVKYLTQSLLVPRDKVCKTIPWNHEKNQVLLSQGLAARLEQTRLETWFGETGLKIWPDVFRHDNYCERII